MIIVRLIGGLGNQMFMYAAGMSIAKYYRTELKIDLMSYATYKNRNYELNAYNIDENIADIDEIEYVKNNAICSDRMDKLVDKSVKKISLCPDNAYLDGYWQSEKYFMGIEDDVRRCFTLKDELSADAKAWEKKILSSPCAVSLSVRRGDYCLPQNLKLFGVCSSEYYKECINRLKMQHHDIDLFVFGDDFLWVKEQLLGFTEYNEVSNVNKIPERLYLLSLCHHHIIPNSTFSWWGAWLSSWKEKNVFVPSQWYDDVMLEAENQIVPVGWIKVPKYKNGINELKKPEIKVSIIIPVYNDEAYIKECLNSVLMQTMDEIEIVCVDDCSTDKSVEIVNEIIAENNKCKIIYINHNENLSPFQARKEGVLACSGNYIMFLDGDDFLEKDACKKAYDEIVKRGVDILQFGSVIENCSHAPEDRIKSNEKMLLPYIGGELSGSLLEESFINKKFGMTIWNKIYRGDICREAFEKMPNGKFYYAEDMLASFYIFFVAKSYAGIEDSLYHYCFGRGELGSKYICFDYFQKICKSADVFWDLKSFVSKMEDDCREKYEGVVENIRKSLIREQCYKWFAYLDEGYKLRGLQFICSAWHVDISYIMGYLSDLFFYRGAEISAILKNSDAVKYKYRKPKNIAIYYRTISNGGAQHVVAELCNLFKSRIKGIENIILVTDEEPLEKEYVVLPSIIREKISSREKSMGINYKKRMWEWHRIVEKYNIDIVISSMWLDKVTLWDAMAIKCHHSSPAYIVHNHNSFGLIYKFYGKEIEEKIALVENADAIVVLSRYDKLFWESYNSNSYVIPNPCTITKHSNCAKHGKHILWVGRISSEKQPLEVIKIMKKVVNHIPDAICHMVGSGSGWLQKKIESEIKLQGLQRNVIMEGFRSDVEYFYKKASVLLMTSMYESFSLVMYEGASYGIPSIMYDIPWLEYCNVIKGWKKVPQLDAEGAACEIIKLLQDESEWKARNAKMLKSFQRYANVDIAGMWSDVLKEVGIKKKTHDDNMKMVYQQMTMFHNNGGKKNDGRLDSQKGRFTFPYRLLNPDTNIVIYGGGEVGKTYLRQITQTNYCRIVSICDQFPDKTGIDDVPVISIDELIGLDCNDYDYILIAIENKSVAEDIKRNLIRAGLEKTKVLWGDPTHKSTDIPKKQIDNECEYNVPYQLLPRKSKVVICGSGTVGESFKRQIMLDGYWEFVGMVDDGGIMNGSVSSVDRLLFWQYDFILISCKEVEKAMSIKRKLFMMGIQSDKIVWDGDIYSVGSFKKNFLFKCYDMVETKFGL